ncbi:Fatty acyl-coenzyme A reductase, NAD-binding domain [Dillenia turbinata]|uniref:Fatty acyl-CoA reductase n=1 Tax=Dillenia turbinata TaxID=194707 RepID=A0AAN8YW78_9MAGN
MSEIADGEKPVPSTWMMIHIAYEDCSSIQKPVFLVRVDTDPLHADTCAGHRMTATEMGLAYLRKQGIVMEKPLYKEETIAKEKFLYSNNSLLSVPNLDVDAEIKIALTSKLVFEDYEHTQAMNAMGINSKRGKNVGWHSTIEFTKAMSKMMINGERGDFPVIILRPSIIQSTLQDHFP